MLSEDRRTRFIRHLLRLHYFYAIALGIISLRYDFRKRCFIPAPLLKAYALCMNLLMVGAAPIAIRRSLLYLGMFGNNRLMRLTYVVNTCIRCTVVMMTLGFRWRRERCAKEFVQQLLEIETDYFDAIAVPHHIQRRFDRIFYVKYFSVFFQTVAVIYTIFELNLFLSAWWLVFYVYFHSTLNVLLGVMFHYFMALWHICKRFCILNVQLERIFRELKQRQGKKNGRAHLRRLAVEVHTIAILHYRLTQLVLRLNEIYKYQVIAVLLTHVLNNTVLGYYSIMLAAGAGGTQIKLNYFGIFFGVLTYTMMLLDLYMTDVTCDAISVASQHSAEIMKQFNELELREPLLVQSCQLMSQHLMQYKLRIRICGMFELNKHTSFILLGTIIEKVIILLQFDLEKRFG